MSPQFPYAQPQSAHAHGVAQAHVAGAFAQPHDFGAQQPSPQSDEQQPGVSKAIPAETTLAANRLRVEFFMCDSISQLRRVREGRAHARPPNALDFQTDDGRMRA